MIVVVEHGAELGLRRVRLRDRLLTRLRASSLDAELARRRLTRVERHARPPRRPAVPALVPAASLPGPEPGRGDGRETDAVAAPGAGEP